MQGNFRDDGVDCKRATKRITTRVHMAPIKTQKTHSRLSSVTRQITLHKTDSVITSTFLGRNPDRVDRPGGFPRASSLGLIAGGGFMAGVAASDLQAKKLPPHAFFHEIPASTLPPSRPRLNGAISRLAEHNFWRHVCYSSSRQHAENQLTLKRDRKMPKRVADSSSTHRDQESCRGDHIRGWHGGTKDGATPQDQ